MIIVNNFFCFVFNRSYRIDMVICLPFLAQYPRPKNETMISSAVETSSEKVKLLFKTAL